MALNSVMALVLRYFTEFVYDVVIKKFRFAILSPDEFLVAIYRLLNMTDCSSCWPNCTGNLLALMKLLLHELHRLCVR